MDYRVGKGRKRTNGFCLFLIGLGLWLPASVFKKGFIFIIERLVCFHNALKFRQG